MTGHSPALRALSVEVGLVGAHRGSLHPWFLPTLLTGMTVGVLLGHRFHDPVDAGWGMVASLLLWQPLVEEALFRGVLQGLLLQTRWGVSTRLGLSAANGVAALAFALAHLVHQPPLWALSTLIPGLCFGWFRDRSGSLWPPLLLHAAFNAAFFWQLIPTLLAA
ncbi:MAG: JDVT-CTERM system glutamic-type intramembrane protease [Pseudomonadales bacterium]